MRNRSIVADVPGTTPLVRLRPPPRHPIAQGWYVATRWRAWGERVVALHLSGDDLTQSAALEAFAQHTAGR